MEFISLTLPAPISTNALWRPTLRMRTNGKRAPSISKTAKYEAWIKEAGWTLQAQRPGKINGPYALTIKVSRSFLGDLDNASKATSDLLQRHGVIENDRLAQKIELTWIAADKLPAGAGMAVMVVACKGAEDGLA